MTDGQKYELMDCILNKKRDKERVKKRHTDSQTDSERETQIDGRSKGIMDGFGNLPWNLRSRGAP